MSGTIDLSQLPHSLEVRHFTNGMAALVEGEAFIESFSIN